MPEVQKLYDTYKNNDRVAIYSIHSRVHKENETNVTGSEILKENNYSFPCLSIDMKDEMLKELGVNRYPTVLIFDKESKLVFRGNIKNAGNYIRQLAL
jgi:hypothetical protein